MALFKNQVFNTLICISTFWSRFCKVLLSQAITQVCSYFYFQPKKNNTAVQKESFISQISCWSSELVFLFNLLESNSRLLQSEMKQVSPLWWLLIRLNSCNRLVSHYHQLSAAPSRALYVTTPGVAPTFMFTNTTEYKVYKYLYLYQWNSEKKLNNDHKTERTNIWFMLEIWTFLWSDVYFESGKLGKLET